MILIGLDLQSTNELKNSKQLNNSRLVFTDYEIQYIRSKKNPDQTRSGIFSAKEAFIKAFSNLQDTPLYYYSSIEIRHSNNGRPYINTKGNIREYLIKSSLKIDLSISHTEETSGATVLIYKDNEC
jgi:phosphopantetheine--protein transferase-like protein